MEIYTYDSGLLHSNMYLVSENEHAIVIDPCKDISPARGKTIDWILLTHEHYDHISGVNAWKEATGAPLLCSKACGRNISNSRKNLSRIFDVFCQIQTWFPVEEVSVDPVEYVCEADQTFEDQTVLNWLGHKVLLREIPGHSEGSIGIDFDGKDFFSGDSVLENREVELRLPGGSRKQWDEVGRKRIDEIKEGTKIWPGHFGGFVFHKG